ncbi:protein of unknown function [Legionella fallonii LLAP-10]|uniref:Uncharacterized protein n=2 Tax=Legionella fallonii TaxID=96230 RepID=A0A098G3T3_9GAMM|nr:protein of unknown function [Legionella fallonii LLAP-10]
MDYVLQLASLGNNWIEVLEKFDKINFTSDVFYLASRFPENKAEIFQLVILPDNFQRLVTKTTDLAYLANFFPHHEIFKKGTVEEALKEVQAISFEQKAYTKRAAMGFFKPIFPQELGDYIGDFLDRKTGRQVAQVNKEAAENASSGYEACKANRGSKI